MAATTSTSATLVAGSTNWTTSVVGTTPSWLEVRARKLDVGRFLTRPTRQHGGRRRARSSTTAAAGCSADRRPVGQTVTLNGISLQVVGVLTSSGASSSSTSSNNDDQALVPYSTATQRLIGGTTRTSVGTIYVEATSASTLSAAYQEANHELLALHGIASTGRPPTSRSRPSSRCSRPATSVDKTLTVLLGGIAAISLLVGGIGVMNIMLVSVTERVREIGLRKALGARPSVIRRQFLVEASVLGLAGGVLGALVGVAGSKVLPHFISSPVAFSPTASVGAIAIAIAIGLAFGVYPASRAARLAPIDALRTESSS